MKVIRKRACDVCGNDEDTVCRYRITKLEGASQRTVTVDLCAEHGGHVEGALASAPVSRRGRKPAKPVVSLDEIPKKASKKATGSRRRG